MIWLASYPRSGNTFFRIVLSEVYGIESSTFHNEPGYPVDANYVSYQVVKTHLLPNQLVPSDPKIPAVYLIRDGRDTVVSMAHQRKSFQDPYSNLYMNMKEVILAKEDTFFGGWSRNVTEWMKRADVVIRFEDLIVDPISEVEKLRAVMDLPDPNPEKLPEFQDLKTKDYHYGTGSAHGFDEKERERQRRFFFRRGKAGGWKDEMPPEIEELFWEHHGKVMSRMSYKRETPKLGPVVEVSDHKKKKVLIEVSKLAEQHVDGGKRYVQELIYGLDKIKLEWEHEFEFDFNIHETIYHGLEFAKESLPRWIMLRQAFLRWLFSTVFSDFLLMVKRLLPHLWGKLKAAKDEREELKGSIYDKYSVVHFTVPQIYLQIPARVPTVVTVHDYSHVHFPEYHLEANVARAEEGMQYFSGRERNEFIAISESTRQDMIAQHAIPEEKISLIYEAGDYKKFYPVNNPVYFNPVKKKYGLPDGRYLLCLSTIEPRKNLVNTIKAFLAFLDEYPEEEIYLVVAGKKGWKYEDVFNSSIDTDRIIFTGYVDDEDISAVYSGALAFLYVSYYEGFGLPILEAMSCGVPVIYGNNSSMREIAGKGGIPASPDDVDEIKGQIVRVLTEGELRNTLKENAAEQAMKFSWARTARETLDLYRKIDADYPMDQRIQELVELNRRSKK
jgi:glycosyltransferase involved in cell wall biosynthesis